MSEIFYDQKKKAKELKDEVIRDIQILSESGK